MKVVFHPLVRRDVVAIKRYYRRVSLRLAAEFEQEFRAIVDAAASNPNRFHLVERGFRRANPQRFPYHVLYDVQPDVVRVMIVKHHKRAPDLGMDRP